MTGARAGLVLAGLVAWDVDDAEYLMDPKTPERLARAREDADGVLLLPGFDELLLGYGDRTAVLDPAFAERIVPGGNGMFRATVVSAGQVVGTWRAAGIGARTTLETEPFEAFSPALGRRIQRAYDALP